jgi:hypothetical protein
MAPQVVFGKRGTSLALGASGSESNLRSPFRNINKINH